jgi:hypothetical protein
MVNTPDTLDTSGQKVLLSPGSRPGKNGQFPRSVQGVRGVLHCTAHM